jgi:hypothetical protein
MNTETIAPQAASCLPNYGPVTDWTFCQSKATYLAFVKEWKENYKLLSAHIRHDKLSWKLSCAKDPAKIARLEKQTSVAPAAMTPWLKANARPWNKSALATWMLSVRAEAKVQAEASYQAAKKAQG